MIPKVEGLAGFYQFQWENGIRATVERIHQHRDGDVTAEVTIRNSNAEASFLDQRRLNLLSGPTKKGLVKDLFERYPLIEMAAWQEIVDQMTVLSIQKERTGEEAQVIGGQSEPAPLRWQLWPLLLADGPTLWYAHGGTGKSILALYCSLLIQRNITENHNGVKLNPTPTNVLYLDWETDSHEQERRITMLQKGLELIPKADLHYRRCLAPLADEVVTLQRIVMEKKVGYAIVDSVVGACGGDLQSQEVTSMFFRAFAHLKIGGLFIAHIAKNTDEKKRTPFGSSFWWNTARSIFELRVKQEPGSSALSVGMFHRKMNNGALLDPIGFRLTFERDAVRVATDKVQEMPDFENDPALSIVQRIEAALKRTDGRRATTGELAEALALSDDTIRKTLGRNQDRFVRLTSEGEKATWGPRSPRDNEDG